MISFFLFLIKTLDLPAWKPKDVVAACGKKPVVAAYDPLEEERPKCLADVAYMRLPGPAGHRSRYDEESVDKITAHCLDVRDDVETTFCVFRNIDMQANGTTVIQKLK